MFCFAPRASVARVGCIGTQRQAAVAAQQLRSDID